MLRDSTVVLTARAVNLVGGLAFVAGATRLLGPTRYGEFAYVLVAGTLFYTITSAWTTAAVPRYGRERFETHDTMVAVTWGRLLLSAPGFVLVSLVLLALKLSGALPADVGWNYVILTIGFGLALSAQDHMLGTLQAAGRMRFAAVVIAGQQALSVLGLGLLVAIGARSSPLSLGCVLGAGTLASAALAIPAVWGLSLWPPSLDRALLRRLAAFSVPLLAFTFSQYLIRWVDLAVIRLYMSTHAVGVYTVSYQVYTSLQTLIGTATTVLIPLFVSLAAAKRIPLIARYLRRVVPQLTLLGATAAGLAAPLCGLLVPLVFGSGFAGAAQPLAILLVSLGCFFSASLVAPLIVLHERMRPLAILNIVAAAINIGGDVLLVGPVGLGISGPAVATTIATAVLAVGYVRLAARPIGSDVRLRPVLIAPVLAGLLPTLLLPTAAGIACGLAAPLILALIILIWIAPFEVADANLVAQLDLPAGVRRWALRVIGALSR